MASRDEMLAQAYERGLLNPQQTDAYHEAMRRGLVKAAPAGGNRPMRGQAYQQTRMAAEDARRAGGVRGALSEASGAVNALTSGLPFVQDASAVLGAALDPRTYTLGDGVGFGEARNAARQGARAATEDFGQRHPVVANVLSTGGVGLSMLTPGGLGSNIVQHAPAGANALVKAGATGMNALRGGVAAGTAGAIYGLGADGTPDERLRQGTTGAVVGAVGGSAFGTALSRAPRPARSKAPTPAQLEIAKNAAYKAVDDMDVRYTPKAFDDFVTGLRDEMDAAKINPRRHPKAMSMVREIERMKGSTPTLTEMDQLRQVIRRDVASSTEEAERFFGQKMIQNLDEFIGSTTQASVTSGNARQGAEAIRTARDLNTRVRKVESITEALEKAQNRTGGTGSGGNINNAIRQNLRSVLERSRNLTEVERQAITDIVRGTAGQNALRQVGKLSPSGNGLMAGLNLGAAAHFGPAGAVPGTVGLVSKFLADRATKRAVTDLVNIMARGGTGGLRAEQRLADMAANDPAVQQIYQQVATLLTRGAGVASASATNGR